jgi:LysR family transcriptional regulator, glycine cleavage system transcriptional activator
MKHSLLRDLPLLELVAVEAVIRLGSVAAAADELSVTPSAVSHRLRQIERALGVPLIERCGRGIAPTPTGEACHAELARLITDFRDTTSALRSLSLQRVHLDVPPVIGATWITPLLPRLRARLGVPGLRFELSTNRVPGVAANPDADLFIDFGIAPPGANARLLHCGTVGAFVAASEARDGDLTPEEINRRPLVRHTSACWLQWMESVFSEVPEHRYAVTFDDPVSAVEACLAGQGPVLVGTLAAQAYVEAGLLRPAHPGRLAAGNYTIELTPRGQLKPLARRTLDHLLAFGQEFAAA